MILTLFLLIGILFGGILASASFALAKKQSTKWAKMSYEARDRVLHKYTAVHDEYASLGMPPMWLPCFGRPLECKHEGDEQRACHLQVEQATLFNLITGWD